MVSFSGAGDGAQDFVPLDNWAMPIISILVGCLCRLGENSTLN